VELAGKVALVTGGGTGLGRAISLALARADVAVALGYSESRVDADAAVADITSAGGRAVALRSNLADWPSAGALASAVTQALGPIDILVNNAGITRYVPFPDLDAVDAGVWDAIFDLNVRATFALSRAVAPSMRARGSGRILNVASNSGITAAGSSVPYVVSKAAVIALTHALARGLAPTIAVNAIAPGWMETRWMERYFPADVRAAMAADATARVTVEEVADAALALLANDAITGEVLVVDRGERWHPERA
jgi:3-oxoacyl-[acyl-carrier protein] reductase